MGKRASEQASKRQRRGLGRGGVVGELEGGAAHHAGPPLLCHPLHFALLPRAPPLPAPLPRPHHVPIASRHVPITLIHAPRPLDRSAPPTSPASPRTPAAQRTVWRRVLPAPDLGPKRQAARPAHMQRADLCGRRHCAHAAVCWTRPHASWVQHQ